MESVALINVDALELASQCLNLVGIIALLAMLSAMGWVEEVTSWPA